MIGLLNTKVKSKITPLKSEIRISALFKTLKLSLSKFHSTFGKTHTNKEQIDTFLNGSDKKIC